jgi:transitional endoplasmic reticulum ATPase
MNSYFKEINIAITRRSRTATHSIETCLTGDPIVRLWLLRLLVPLGCHKDFIRKNGFANDLMAQQLGLGAWVDKASQDFEPGEVLTELRKDLREVEKEFISLDLAACLSQNIQRLSDLVGLSETDRRILEFAVMLQNERVLDDAAGWLGNLSSVKVFHSLSVVLALPESEVRAALAPNGPLARSGLVSIDQRGSSTLRGKLDLLSETFADHICSAETDPVNLLRGMVTLAGPARLTLSDYSHITSSLDILRSYLRHAIATARSGLNIYLHGAPGMGKSELARVLAAELGSELFEVASEDADGDPVCGHRRLRGFSAAQSFLTQRQALIVFDEVEDVFNNGDSLFGRKSTAQSQKAWVNRILEINVVPTLWLSNSIGSLDPAFVRRFDMVIELPIPPKSQRMRIIGQQCQDLLEPGAIAMVAESQVLAPAVVARAAAVVSCIRGELGASKAADAFIRLINSTLEAQGHATVRPNDPNQLSSIYDPCFIRADADLAQIAAGLVESRSGRLCLYGPPGTGKTTYGRWIAEQMGVPLLVLRASDLMSKWVGGVSSGCNLTQCSD